MATLLARVVSRPRHQRLAQLTCVSPRRFISRFSHFPGTLYHFSRLRKSRLYDHALWDDLPHDLHQDGVIVSKDGKVRSGVDDESGVENGATFYPNTFIMQEFFRRYFDEYLDLEEEGHVVDPPMIFTIPKATPVPSTLSLYHIHTCKYSLQPSAPLSIEELNQALEDFYDKYAQKELAEDWIDKHPFNSAVGDDQIAAWMSK